MIRQRTVFVLVALGISLVVPLFVGRNIQDVLTQSCIYAIASLGVGLLLHTCGIANVGQALFYGLGAYSSTLLAVNYGTPSPTGFLVGILISASLAFVVGWLVLRLSGYFLALATLALTVIGYSLFFEWSGLTGGMLGIGGVPKISLFGVVLDTPLKFYYFALAILIVALVLARNLVESRTGLMLRALRGAPLAAASLSIEARSLRTQVFVLSAVLGSIAGSLHAHYASFVNVESFDVGKSIIFLLIPVLGGANSVGGLVVGALFVTLLPELLSSLGRVHQILFGLALVLVVTFMPNGLVGMLKERVFAKSNGTAK